MGMFALDEQDAIKEFALFTNSPYWNDNEAAPDNGGSGM